MRGTTSRTARAAAARRGLEFYIASKAGLKVTHTLPYKLTAKAGLSFGVDKYPEAPTAATYRRDDNYSQMVGLDYDIQKWLKVGGSFEHYERNSTQTAAFNYDVTYTSIYGSLMF